MYFLTDLLLVNRFNPPSCTQSGDVIVLGVSFIKEVTGIAWIHVPSRSLRLFDNCSHVRRRIHAILRSGCGKFFYRPLSAAGI